MHSHTSAEVKGQSIGLVTANFDGESQLSKDMMVIVWKDLLPGYPCCCSSDSGAVLGLFSSAVQHTPAVIH